VILFALQVCPLDVRDGIELVHLICQMEPKKTQREWLICYRKDTPLDRVWTMQRALSAKFDRVFIALAQRFASGWPAGSNALWFSTMLQAAELHHSGEIEAEGVLTFEPDNVPLRRDWMDRLENAWEHRAKPIVGNLHHSSIPDHINGNAIFPIEFLEDYPEMFETPPLAAWDYHNRELLLRLAQDSPYLTQLYQHKNMTLAEWRGLTKFTVRPALLHGVKDGSARIFARADLLAKNTLAPPRKLVLQP
jgi:hypothetical protein